jgi:small subunit ribosomal protein S20
MANHSATKKAIRKTVTKTAINKNKKTRIKTYIKRVLAAVQSGSAQEANKALIEAQSEIMSGVACNILKKNTGARKVSRLSKKVKEITGASVLSEPAKEAKPAVKKATTKPAEAKEVAEKKPATKKPAATKTAAKKPATKKDTESK